MSTEPEPLTNGTVSAEAPDEGELEQGRLRILVVEDHEPTAEATMQLLQRYGYEVQVALDGSAALQATQDAMPDVVLLDINLPGMDGCEVARRMAERAKWKRPLFIAVTGLGEESDRQRSVEAGIDLHLLKPIDPERLEALLRRFQRIIL